MSNNNRRRNKKPLLENGAKIKVISLGGVGEIGKNMFVFEYEQEIVVIDGGLKFPEEDMLGIDIVIPDISYLVENMDRISAFLITHGHEDHIGGLPYILRQVNKPVYGTRLTLGLLQGKLKEKGMLGDCDLREIEPGATLRLSDNMEAEFYKVNHSIPDSVGIALRTPAGLIVHSGDFKFDQTPVDGKVADFHRLAQYGREGVLLSLVDATNAERPGYTQSETTVGDTIAEVFRLAENRIILATFASNVHRIQQVINAAAKYKRKVVVNGRSMVNVVNIAMELGYLHMPQGLLVDIDVANKLPHNKVAMITTGSQGEPMSALSRMANNEHRQVEIVPGDTVIFAATPIPGNEKLVSRTIDNLFRRGAEVIYESVSGVHVSGHASQEEIKLMLNLLRPKYAIPIHGEYRMNMRFRKLCGTLGLPAENVPIIKIGEVWEFSKQGVKNVGTVPAGNVLVDGLGVGDVGNIVLRDRKQLSLDGILMVVMTIDKAKGVLLAGPDIITRGFVYVRESEKLIEDARDVVRKYMEKSTQQQEWSVIKSGVREVLNRFLYEKTRRNPMIIPIIMEV